MSTIATYRTRIARSLRGCTLNPSLRLMLFEEGFCLSLFGFLIALPFLDRWAREPREVVESWGAYYHEHAVVWCWGDFCKFFHMPWQFTHISWKVRRADGTWAKRVESYESGEPDGREVFVLPYRYVLQSGEVQERTATIHVERGEWRRRFLKWCPWFAKIRTSINIVFSDEVGERTGSWKGGCIGTGYTMLPGETAEQTLRRMEVERKF